MRGGRKFIKGREDHSQIDFAHGGTGECPIIRYIYLVGILSFARGLQRIFWVTVWNIRTDFLAIVATPYLQRKQFEHRNIAVATLS